MRTGDDNQRACGNQDRNEHDGRDGPDVAEDLGVHGRHQAEPVGIGHAAGELEIEALPGAIAIHGGEQDFARAEECARRAIALGCKGLMVPSRHPRGHSPSHIGLDPVWRAAEEAGLPILFHVGGEEKMHPAYVENGLPKVKDFHGGEENFTSLTYMAIPHSVMLSLAALIIDGVLDRFPKLKVGVIELGASWLPGWMRYLDAGAAAFIKNEDRLKRLSAKPSEIVRRQVRVTPYPHEDAGWIIANSGEDICLFSSDYPHVEGGRNPLKRFDESLASVSSAARTRFYAENFIDLMGEGLAEDLRRPQHLRAA